MGFQVDEEAGSYFVLKGLRQEVKVLVSGDDFLTEVSMDHVDGITGEVLEDANCSVQRFAHEEVGFVGCTLFSLSSFVIFCPILLDDTQVSGLESRSSFLVVGLEILFFEFGKVLQNDFAKLVDLGGRFVEESKVVEKMIWCHQRGRWFSVEEEFIRRRKGPAGVDSRYCVPYEAHFPQKFGPCIVVAKGLALQELAHDSYTSLYRGVVAGGVAHAETLVFHAVSF